MSDRPSEPLIHINIFSPKPGHLADFMATQLEGLPKFGDIPGLLGSHLYEALDGTRAVMIAAFVDEAAHKAFMETPAFLAHRARLQPLMEGASSGYYRLRYERGPSAGMGANLPAGEAAQGSVNQAD